MASFAAVAARIRAACEKGAQARTALEQAEDLAEEAHATLARALEGAHHLDADAAQVLSAFARVVDGCKGYLWPLLNEVLKNAERYADSLTSEPSAHQAPPDNPPAVPANRIEQLRRELPPAVVPGTGQRTHGRWIGPDGRAQPIVSGNDARSKLVKEQLTKKGMTGPMPRSGDVEMKLAAYMAANGIRHATVVINHVVCTGKRNCDTLVPILLPEGATLTVCGINPNGTRTRTRYTGGAQPWWT